VQRIFDEPGSDPVLTKLAKENGMTIITLRMYIKSMFGMLPSKLTTKLKMQKAAQLLIINQESIRQIALQVGYDNEGNFSKAFKKAYGETPASYRDKANEL
jgi:two-component system response regulator YesN